MQRSMLNIIGDSKIAVVAVVVIIVVVVQPLPLNYLKSWVRKTPKVIINDAQL